MHKHDSEAPVQFAMERFIAVVAEIHAGAAGFDGDPVAVKFIECVAELVARYPPRREAAVRRSDRTAHDQPERSRRQPRLLPE